MRERGLIFALCTASLLALVLSKRWVYFIPPRFFPLAIFLCAACALWALVSLLTRSSNRHAHGNQGTAVFLLIPIVAWSLPYSLSPSQFLGNTGQSAPGSQIPVNSHESGASATDFHADTVITADNYYESVIDMVTHPEQWDGRKIEVSGFVLPKDRASSEAGMPPFGPDDDFGLARMTMWCCAADAYALGFAVSHSSSPTPQTDQWVRIQGTLGVRNSKALYLNAETITPISAPDSPFVYEKR